MLRPVNYGTKRHTTGTSAEPEARRTLDIAVTVGTGVGASVCSMARDAAMPSVIGVVAACGKTCAGTAAITLIKTGYGVAARAAAGGALTTTRAA